MQEPLLLCMTRLATLLSPHEITSLEIADVRQVVRGLGEAALADKKKVALIKRCEQFEKAIMEPDVLKEIIGNKDNISVSPHSMYYFFCAELV